MARRQTSVIHKESLTPLATATATATIPATKTTGVERISFFILAVGQDVTVDIKCKIPTDGGTGGFDLVDLDGATGGTATAGGPAFIFTTGDLYPGEIQVDITAGGVAPTRVEVVAVALR